MPEKMVRRLELKVIKDGPGDFNIDIDLLETQKKVLVNFYPNVDENGRIALNGLIEMCDFFWIDMILDKKSY